jgi:hypothetical protein
MSFPIHATSFHDEMLNKEQGNITMTVTTFTTMAKAVTFHLTSISPHPLKCPHK